VRGLPRRRRLPGARGDRPGDDVAAHLTGFATSRRGVEGFVEPETLQTPTTLVLVATDGEWTRRRIGSPRAAYDLCSRLGVPVYDVAAVGYPPRMREWTTRHKDRAPQD
jgi:hypothetical protein